MNIPYFDLNKQGTNGHATNVNKITILGITLKKRVWINIIIIVLMMAILATIGYKSRQYERKINMFMNSAKAYAMVAGKERTFEDERVQKLYDTLESYNSPLAGYAEYIVAVSDEYAIDYTLVAAIAGKESSFGKIVKPDSYNAWGIMAWDEQGTRYIRSFSSWQEGIRFEAELLSKHYRENAYSGIQAKYCPSFECSPTWTTDVAGFSEEINN